MGLFGDLLKLKGKSAKGGLMSTVIDRFSNYLPFRSYDPSSRLYVNQGSIGFILEVTPMIGGDERVVNILSQMLSEGYASGMVLEFHSWLSPRVAPKLNEWFIPRANAGGIHHEMARHRMDYLNAGAWSTLGGDVPFLIRRFRSFVTAELPSKSNGDVKMLATLRDSIMANFATVGLFGVDLEPEGLIGLVDEMTTLTRSPFSNKVRYNNLDPIGPQCVGRDFILKQEIDRLVFRTEQFDHTAARAVASGEPRRVEPEYFDVRSFIVRNFPTQWALWDGANLIGDLFAEALTPPCPIMTTLSFEVQDQELARSKATVRHMRKRQQAESVTGKWNAQLGPQSEDWKRLIEDIAKGQNVVTMFYGITMFSQWGEGDTNERVIKSMYKANGWDLVALKRMHTFGLLAGIPMALGSGLFETLKRNALCHTMTTAAIANLVPLQGEYLGGTKPHMLLTGWRGQPFFWSPVENTAGNHNVVVFGKSGSGKSVFLQELTASLVGSGSHVITIDDGRSFQNSAELQGARIIEFTMSSGFSLNVFRMIDKDLLREDGDYRLESMSLLKAMVGQMARFTDKLNDTERGIIDVAVNEVWESHEDSAQIDHIIDHLLSQESEIAKNLGISMQAFGSKGTFGGLFVGEPSFSLSDRFTVFELSDLSGHEEMRAVVLTAIMFMSSQAMRKLDRSIPKALIIDEAWQLLKGGSMADFVETYARTCRKYGSSLITATQSLGDYYKSEGSTAALENSDWSVLLEQKPETISAIRNNDRFEMSDYLEKVVRATKRKGHYYSGVVIRGPDVVAVGKLVIDPYSAVIYSSSPDVFGRINALRREGYELTSIIGHIAHNEPLRLGSPPVDAAPVESVGVDELVEEPVE